MYGVFCDEGQVESFDTYEEAKAFADRENKSDPGTYWVLHVTTIGGGGFPKG